MRILSSIVYRYINNGYQPIENITVVKKVIIDEDGDKVRAFCVAQPIVIYGI